jgi:exonuclease III
MGVSNSKSINTPIKLPSQLRIMSYNVEWGFLELPSDINYDACGHKLPHTKLAQDSHLNLIAKNIGLCNPDICFLQEIGSLDAINYIRVSLNNMFGTYYNTYYSNNEEKGYQGVGILIKENFKDYYIIKEIPNFPLNRALCVLFDNNGIIYNFVGLHLKSLCDGKIEKDTKEQLQQLSAVKLFCKDSDYVVITGDFNNVENSEPIKKMIEYNYINLINTNKYIENITCNNETEFSLHNKNTEEKGSMIDYMFCSEKIKPLSFNIVNLTRENQSNKKEELRLETSDHLPILGIFKL